MTRARTRLAALLAVLPLSVVMLAACGDDDEPSAQDPNDNSSQSDKPTKEQSPTEEPTESASDTGSPATVAVPIYFVGDTPQGPRLFREFRQVEADNPLAEAVALMTAGDADGPRLPGRSTPMEALRACRSAKAPARSWSRSTTTAGAPRRTE